MNGPVAAALAGRKDLAVRYTAFRKAAHSGLDATLVAMIRQVVAQVHGHPLREDAPIPAEKNQALAYWRNSEAFTDGERACLAYAERMPFEHTAITDAEAAAVVDALGEEGFVAFSVVVALADAECRASMIELPDLARAS